MSDNQTDDDTSAALSTPVDTDTLDRLQRRLEQVAGRKQLIDVAYTIIDTPVGSLLLAATSTGSGPRGSDGTLGGYVGGRAATTTPLELERVA